MTIRIMKPLTGIWDNCRFCATIISMSIAKPGRRKKVCIAVTAEIQMLFSNFFEKRRRRTYLNLQAMYVRCTSKNVTAISEICTYVQKGFFAGNVSVMMTSKTMNLSKSLVSLEILLTRTVGPLAPRAPLSHPPNPFFGAAKCQQSDSHQNSECNNECIIAK
jgi:hypothetical protein